MSADESKMATPTERMVTAAEQVGGALAAALKKDEPRAEAKDKPKDEAKTASPGPVDQWRRAINRTRDAATWTVRAFVALLTAAIGSGPFVVLDEIDGAVELIWTMWGLVAALGGAMLVIKVAGEISLPQQSGSAVWRETNDPEDSELQVFRARVDADQKFFADQLEGPKTCGDWRAGTSIAEQLGYVAALQRSYWQAEDVLVAELAKGKDNPRIASAKQSVEVSKRRFEAEHTMLDAWAGEAMFEQMRRRYRSLQPALFTGAALTAIGLLAFLGFARIDAGELAIHEAKILPEAVTEIFPSGDDEEACEIEGSQRVSIVSGSGSEGDPWNLEFLGDAVCGQAGIDVTGGQVELVLISGSEPDLSSSTIAGDFAADASDAGVLLDAAIGAWMTLLAVLAVAWHATNRAQDHRERSVGFAGFIGVVGVVGTFIGALKGQPSIVLGTSAFVVLVAAIIIVTGQETERRATADE